MGTCLRLVPALVIALLGVTGPTGLPPGASPGKTPIRLTVKCPNPNCGRGRWQPMLLKYKCNECTRLFNYCYSCESSFWDEESRMHMH